VLQASIEDGHTCVGVLYKFTIDPDIHIKQRVAPMSGGVPYWLSVGFRVSLGSRSTPAMTVFPLPSY
jgi:hypothetical protein